MIQTSTFFTQTTWSQIYRFGLVFNRIIFAFIFVILIPWLQFCPPLTVYNLMYIYQILFLSTLVAAFSLSMSKLLSVLLRNMDFRNGNFFKLFVAAGFQGYPSCFDKSGHILPFLAHELKVFQQNPLRLCAILEERIHVYLMIFYVKVHYLLIGLSNSTCCYMGSMASTAKHKYVWSFFQNSWFNSF